MNGRIAKRLRKMAVEMMPGCADRNLVKAHGHWNVINHPRTVRGAYLALKKAFKNRRRGA